MSLEAGGWMIGDSLVADIAGGRAAGLRTVWIDRGRWLDDEHQADHVVPDVLQAMEILNTQTADLANANGSNKPGQIWTAMD
ncbi:MULTISPECIES: HAD family hydrolase [unclassified Microbispora]|uniref:HAD family hydrolase n=1 Tax=unclassified Microbispora TaxID=2614687 RepID=UPI001F109DF7|nr:MULTISPECIES: HAD hydrolase-like protein [unclassified Microbispora]